MDTQLIGQAAAVFTSFLWTLNSILFAAAGRRIGALSVNAFRIVMAAVFLALAHIFLLGTMLPDANNAQWIYLGLSGIIGLGIGDFGYFGALVKIGPRRSVLLMALAPIFSVIAAFFVLDEKAGAWTYIGISVTLLGVIIVILERRPATHAVVEPHIPKKQMMVGVFAGVVGSVGQGFGLVISKYGMEDAADAGSSSLDPLSATLIRMVIAGVFIWVVVLVTGRSRPVLKAVEDKEAMKRTLGGAALGPFLGVWMSMVAISYTLTGVASTLMSLMPVMVIPLVWVLYKQRTNWQGIAGAVIAVVGVAILFLM